MATRRVIQRQPTETLEQMLSTYVETKDELEPLKKQESAYNKKIKQEMQNRNIDQFVFNGIKASITITPKSDFNELQAIEILRKELKPAQFKQVVKQREYIDDDAFEKLVYNHEVDAAILAPAETPKEPTVTLRIRIGG